MTPRHRRLLGVFVGFALLLPLVGQPLASAAPIDDKRAEAARLQDELEAKGEQVSIMAERYNRARAKVAEVEEGMVQTEADVARSDERLKLVKDRLASAAVTRRYWLRTIVSSGRPLRAMVLRIEVLPPWT